MDQQKLFMNHMSAKTVKLEQPSQDKIAELEKDLLDTANNAKADTESQSQTGAGQPTQLQKKLKLDYVLEDKIDYDNKLGDFSSQLQQSIKDVQRLTQPMLLSTLQSKDTPNVTPVDVWDEKMLFSVAQNHRSQKSLKTGQKRPVLSHWSPF